MAGLKIRSENWNRDKRISELVDAGDLAGAYLVVDRADWKESQKIPANSITSGSIAAGDIGVGSIARSVADKLGEIPSVLDFIPSSQHAAIKARSLTDLYDCTADIIKTLAAGKYIHFPAGLYWYADVIPFGDRTIFGDGTSSDDTTHTGGSELRALTQIARCTVDSWGNVINLYVDGNYAADCGVIMLPNKQGIKLIGVKTRKHNLAGITADNTQNAEAYGCNSENNFYNFFVINSAGAVNFNDCNGRLDETNATATYNMANQRNIKISSMTGGYFSSSAGSGNKEIRFDRGIYEDGTLADANIEIDNLVGRAIFDKLEITECAATGDLIRHSGAGASFFRQNTYNGPATGGNTIGLVAVSAGSVFMDPIARRGNAGKYSPNSGIKVSGTGSFHWLGGGYEFVVGKESNFMGSIGIWTGGGTGGIAAWEAGDGGRLVVTSTSVSSGATITPDGLKQAALEATAGQRLIRVKFDALEVGGTGQQVVALFSGNRHTIGFINPLAAGNSGVPYEFAYRPFGDETGVIGIYGRAAETVIGKYKNFRIIM